MRNKKKKNMPRVHKYADMLNDEVDYKDADLLRTFTSNYQRLLPRDRFNLTAKQQRNLATAVKRARYMALLPYTNHHADQK